MRMRKMEDYSQAILLTGRRGVGKTTVCQAVAELARRRGYRPAGVITPALYACPEQSRRDSHGVKAGFEAVDVGSGERWLLARTDPSTIFRPFDGVYPEQSRRAQGRPCSGQGSGHRRELGGPRVGPYSFAPAALARAIRVLRRAATIECDLFIVDEIGPLELKQGEGFAPILDLLPIEGPTHTLIVVRPELLDQLLLHLRDTEPTVLNVTEENRDKLPRQIVEVLWEVGTATP